MGADWYTCLTYFGYKIKVPENTSYRNFVNEVNKINEFLEEPYKITGLLRSFHSRMEYSSDYELQELDSGATIIIGFKLDNNVDTFTQLVNELKEYVIDNYYLMGLELSDPQFYSGIDWFDKYYEYKSSSDEDDDDDDNDDGDDDGDDDNNDDYYDDDTSDDDELKIAPEHKTKSD